MDKKDYPERESGTAPITELKWMAEFLASHGQQKKALEIYRALLDTLTRKSADDRKEPPARAKGQAAWARYQSRFSNLAQKRELNDFEFYGATYV